MERIELDKVSFFLDNCQTPGWQAFMEMLFRWRDSLNQEHGTGLISTEQEKAEHNKIVGMLEVIEILIHLEQWEFEAYQKRFEAKN